MVQPDTTSGPDSQPDRSPIKKWAKVRLWTGYVYILLALIFARPVLPWAIAGLVLVIAGTSLRLISSATLVKDRELCTDGIYAMTRNPLYLGSALIALGFASLTSSLWFLGGFTLVPLPMYMRMILIEEKYLVQLWPEEFPEYIKSVPRFLPRLWPLPKLSGTLDRGKLSRSGELTTTLIFIVIVIILLAWHRTWLPT